MLRVGVQVTIKIKVEWIAIVEASIITIGDGSCLAVKHKIQEINSNYQIDDK